MMMAEALDSSVSDSVCQTQTTTEEGQTLRLSPRKNTFRKDFVFEKVCCMPSSSSSSSSSAVSTSKSPGMQCGRRSKASAGSPTEDGSSSSSKSPCRPPSESRRACGREICFRDTRIISNEGDDGDAPSPNENESNGILGSPGKEGQAMSSSSEPLGEEEGTRELTIGEGGKIRLPDDVVYHSAAERSSLSMIDRWDDSDISHGMSEGGAPRQDDRLRRAASETSNRRTETSPATKGGTGSSRSPSRARALLVTDIDAVDGHLEASAPIGEHSTALDGGQSKTHETPRSSPADVLWEFNGRRLSNFCQNLMTECVVLEDEEEEEGAAHIVSPGIVALATRETCVDDDDDDDCSGCGVHATVGWPMTPISTVGDDLLLSDRKTPNRAPSSLGHSSRMDDSGLASTDTTTCEDEITVNMSGRDNRSLNTSSKQRSGLTSDDAQQDSVNEKSSMKSPSTDMRREPGATTPPRCDDEKTSSLGKAGKDSGDGIYRPAPGGRRGRTMERGKYEASLLKDFIRPDQKKFSIAPSPPQQDFSIDVELAIWEATDFVIPDRHMSAPPAVLPLRLTKTEDALLRSRQTSVSPQRQRTTGAGGGGGGGPRGGKGSKSVELLSTRHMSPSGAKIRRRTLSKEWQVLTFTTREEITTLIRPKTAKGESRVEAERDEDETVFQNCHPTESSESPPKDSGGAQRRTKTGDARFSNTASEREEDLFIAESSTDFPSVPSDLPGLRLSPDSREKSEATENSLPLLCSNDSQEDPTNSDVWEVISGALSDAMRHVRWAESSTPIEKTKSSSVESTYDNMAAADESSSELLLLGGSATVQNDNISSGNLSETKDSDISETCDRSDRNGSSSPSMELDELVKALLDIANESDGGVDRASNLRRPLATVDDSYRLFEMTNGEFLESSNENDFPFSRHHVNRPIPLNDHTHLTRVKAARPAVENNNSSLIQNEAGLTEDEIAERGNMTNTSATTTDTTTTTRHLNRNTLSKPEIESAFVKSVLDRINCPGDDDDDDDFAVENNDSILQISEELEIFEPDVDPSLGLFDSAEPLERIPAEQVVDRTTDSAADGDTGRRRAVASNEDGANEVTSLSRRAAEESADLFPEKAFLESLFSSLGTIVFLLLAALIFHLLNRLVEHEL